MKSNCIIVQLSILALLVISFTGPSVFGQVSESWVAHYNGEANDADYARDLEIDHEGNVYAVGTSMGMDGEADIVTVSFDSEGEERWAARFDGADGANDWGYSIARDSAGNIYVAGSSQSYDTGKDLVVIKYDDEGHQLWVGYYNSPTNEDDEAIQVEVDCGGNAVAAGTSQGPVSISDYVTVKFGPDGDTVWSARYNGPGNSIDEARALAVDCSGNVYVSGGSIDDSTYYDYATIKYDQDGNEQWVARYDGPAHGYDVVYYPGSVLLDSDGNVYVTGYSEAPDSNYNYLTVKYDSLGNMIWADRYTGSQGNDYADALYLDDSGNLYVTGASYDSVSSYDFVTIKYDPYGQPLWTSHYNGTGDDWDEAYGIGVDADGNVYVVGRSVGDNTLADFTTVKYSPFGAELWSIRYDGSAHNFDWPFRLLVDQLSNVYVAGWSIETGRSSDFTIVKYEQTQIGIDNPNSSVRPSAFLFHNYPNPFNSRTQIRYYLSDSVPVRLVVYNVLGQNLGTLVDSDQQEGYHDVIWDSGDNGSGIYFYKLITTDMTLTGSMILLR